MAQVARAYRTTSAAWAYPYPDYPDYSEERFSASDIHAVRTGGAPREEQQKSLLPTLGVLAAIVLVVVAALSFARIALTNAAVTTMIESDALSAQIEEARASGVGLEMQQSVLSSPTAINSAVKRLGMVTPAEVGELELEPDVVAFDESGSLSLSDSVKNLVSNDEAAKQKAAEAAAEAKAIEEAAKAEAAAEAAEASAAESVTGIGASQVAGRTE